MSAEAPTEHHLGLRFRRSQARTLAAIAARLEQVPNAHDQITLFNQAAESAKTGEPLVVVCSDPVEAVVMADAFTMWGAARPTVESLSPS